jgi:hypothetical protein
MQARKSSTTVGRIRAAFFRQLLMAFKTQSYGRTTKPQGLMGAC